MNIRKLLQTMILSKRLLPSLDVEQMGGAAVNDDEGLAVLEWKRKSAEIITKRILISLSLYLMLLHISARIINPHICKANGANIPCLWTNNLLILKQRWTQ